MSHEPAFFDTFSASKRPPSILGGLRNSQANSNPNINGYYPSAVASTPMNNSNGNYNQYAESNMFGTRLANPYNQRASMVPAPALTSSQSSRIPEAPMSLKRNRSSMAGTRPSNIGAPQRNNALLGSPAKRSVKPMPNSRKSIAQLPSTNVNRGPAFSGNRRQSTYIGPSPAAATNMNRRQSLHPATPALHQSSMNHYTPGMLSTIPKDPRPLRDKTYQAEISQTIYEYLVKNKFDLEMKHPLLQKTVRSPTQKDFVLMYQFLFRRLDPEYSFVRGFDVEVFQSLRALEYPYIDTLSRNELSAVGQNWPPYLGVIYWLTQGNMALDSLLDSEEDTVTERSEEYLDQLTYEFTTKAYLNYLNNNDDYSQHENELRSKIRDYNISIMQLIEERQKEANELDQKDQELLVIANALAQTEEKKAILDDDDMRMQEYTNNLKDYKEKYTAILAKLMDKKAENEKRLTHLREQNKSIESKMSMQKISPSEIEHAKRKIADLSVTAEKVHQTEKDLLQKVKTKEQETRGIYNELEPVLKLYNQEAGELSDMVHSLKGRIDHQLDINFSIDLRGALDPGKLGQPVDKLLNGKNINLHIRDKLKSFLDEVITSWSQFSSRHSELNSELKIIKEELRKTVDKNAEVSARCARNKQIYNERSKAMEDYYNERIAEVDRIETKIQATKAEFNMEHSQVQESYNNIDEKYEDLAKSIDRARAAVVTKVNDLVEFLAQHEDSRQHIFLEYESLIDEDLNECEQQSNELSSLA